MFKTVYVNSRESPPPQPPVNVEEAEWRIDRAFRTLAILEAHNKGYTLDLKTTKWPDAHDDPLSHKDRLDVSVSPVLNVATMEAIRDYEYALSWLRVVTNRQKEIIIHRLQMNRGFEEISVILGTSRQNVHNTFKRAMQRCYDAAILTFQGA